ncbi:CrcB family protein [Halalkalicoccus sp. NIPERK01]|uniref:fluoride efflux transporter FluC n=1 Tax=Halalkalicoccus sp. NIPERK01 TaxID=3053469 RepID=UPI00256F293D|nr:CrcB family protein [Halalkalicoccus sp. NIPERK01]MDL5360973.1 CrcB family protein [Halalkalicoccus sp. NIPERK01]
MIEALLVGVGGAVGAVSRYLVGLALGDVEGPFPFETLAVNVVGSFLLGWVTFAGFGEGTLLVVGVGTCGAFTTFSSFSVDTVRLAEDETVVLAAGYALVNLLLSVGGVGLAALVATV